MIIFGRYLLFNICNFAPGNSKSLSMSRIKRPYLRGKQTQILRGQQRGNGSAKMISMAMQFIIINLIKKYRINSFLMQELKLYMA